MRQPLNWSTNYRADEPFRAFPNPSIHPTLTRTAPLRRPWMGNTRRRVPTDFYLSQAEFYNRGGDGNGSASGSGSGGSGDSIREDPYQYIEAETDNENLLLRAFLWTLSLDFRTQYRQVRGFVSWILQLCLGLVLRCCVLAPARFVYNAVPDIQWEWESIMFLVLAGQMARYLPTIPDPSGAERGFEEPVYVLVPEVRRWASNSCAWVIVLVGAF